MTIDEVQVSKTEGMLDVNATIENTGNSSDTQTVALMVDGIERDSRELTLGGGEAQTVRFLWEEPADVQEYNLNVSSEDDSDVWTAQDQGLFDFDIEWPPPERAVSLLLLLLALLLVYYYVRRRRSQAVQSPVSDEQE